MGHIEIEQAYVFLNLNLLELHEFTASRLQIQSAASFVDSAVLRWTFGNGHKSERVYGLISFSSATVAGVGSDNHHWLNFSAASHDTANRHQLSDVLSFDFANRQSLGDVRRLERDFEATHQLGRESVVRVSLLHWVSGASLHEQSVLDIHIQRVLGDHIALLIVRQELLDDSREEVNVAATVLLDCFG